MVRCDGRSLFAAENGQQCSSAGRWAWLFDWIRYAVCSTARVALVSGAWWLPWWRSEWHRSGADDASNPVQCGRRSGVPAIWVSFNVEPISSVWHYITHVLWSPAIISSSANMSKRSAGALSRLAAKCPPCWGKSRCRWSATRNASSRLASAYTTRTCARSRRAAMHANVIRADQCFTLPAAWSICPVSFRLDRRAPTTNPAFPAGCPTLPTGLGYTWNKIMGLPELWSRTQLQKRIFHICIRSY